MYHTPGFQHRNIVDFHGCIVENGHVAGLVLARLSETLSTIAFSVWLKHVQMGAPAPTLISDDGIPYDHDSVMDDIRPAIEHLKKLGLIYLDLKLENIMWAWDTEKVKEGEVKQGRWCLIDFDDLYPAGKHFDVAPGTPGWKSDKGGVAEDLLEITLAKLSRYLTTGKMTGDHGEPESEPSPEMVEYRNIVRGIQEARQEARQRQKALHTSAKAKAL